MNVDLHIHSTASDGSLGWSEIIDLARKLKLKAIAITDHDTLDGSREAILSGIPSSLHFLTGVEISSSPPESFSSRGSFHILGYGIELDNNKLNDALAKARETRETRNPKIIKLLNRAGIAISFDEVVEESGGGLVGRPHMASLMVKKGYADSIKEAFDLYLAKGKPAYVEKFKMACQEAISMIKEAGGIPVLAHPVTLGMEHSVTESLLSKLKDMGLMGIEAYYSDHSPDDTRLYCKLAHRLGLLVTGGSDFHGTLKNDVKMGSGKGGLSVPFDVYQTIISAIEAGSGILKSN